MPALDGVAIRRLASEDKDMIYRDTRGRFARTFPAATFPAARPVTPTARPGRMRAVSSLRATTPDSLVQAYNAGVAYWRNNRPQATFEGLISLARSCGWRDESEICAWINGYVESKTTRCI